MSDQTGDYWRGVADALDALRRIDFPFTERVDALADALAPDNRHACQLCGRRIAPGHFKRHLWSHDRKGVDRAKVDAAWNAFVDQERP